MALIAVGSDTCLVASGTGLSDTADLIVKLDGIAAGTPTVADFL